MVEQTISGTIESWSKPKIATDKTPMYASVSCKINNEWYMFFGDKNKPVEEAVKELKEAFSDKAPKGSNVEFVQWKASENDKYWNYKKDSFKVVSKASTSFQSGTAEDFLYMKRRHPQEERVIIRQNVLNRAVDMYIADKIESTEVIPMAESFEAWILGKKEVKTMDEQYTELEEETVDEVE